MRLIFGTLAIALALTLVSAAKAQDGNAAPPTNQENQQDPKTNAIPTDDAAAKQLMDALDQLIPGDLDDKSERYKKLTQAIVEFRSRKPLDAEKIFEEISKTEKTFPPKTLMMAGLFFAVNDATRGRALLEKTTLDYPEYPATYAGFARMAINTGRVTDADALLRLMKTKIEGASWTKDQMEQFQIEWLDIMTDVAIARSKLDEANNHLIQLKTILPDNGKIPLRQAEVAFKQEKVADAIKFLDQARAKQDNVLASPLVIANWYRAANKLDKLEEWITKASTDHPDDKNVQVEYARWLIEKGKLSKANIWISKAVQGGANEYTTTYMKGQIAFLKQSYDLAELHFSRIHNAQPANVDAANLLALSLVESGNLDKQRKALELATVSVRMNPQNISSISVLGWIFLKTGNAQQAAAHLGKVTQANRIPPESAYFVAKFLADQNRTADAIKVLRAIDVNQGVFLYRAQADALLTKLTGGAGQPNQPKK